MTEPADHASEKHPQTPSLDLLRWEDDGGAARFQLNVRAIGGKNKPHTILLAEDDPALRALLAEILTTERSAVTPVADGLQLGEELSTTREEGRVQHYDVVITDIRMPGRSGLAVLQEHRKRDWSTPFILITAFGDNLTQAKAQGLGAYLFSKPFDPRELASYVDCLLRRISQEEPRSLAVPSDSTSAAPSSAISHSWSEP